MSDVADISSSRPRGVAFGARAAAVMPAVLVLVLAAITRAAIHLNADTSWLLTVGERMLAGAQPYVDFLETNPPASILLYVPAVWLGGATGVAPETIVIVLVFAAALASVTFCGKLLLQAHLMRAQEAPLFAAAALVMLLVLPFYTFAEREHIALIAVLPMLCIYAARAAGASVDWRAAVFAGLGGGIAVAIKPHFALALLFPFIFALWQQRKDAKRAAAQAFAPENIAAALTGAAYAICVLRFFPAYTKNVLPIMMTLYVPAAAPILRMIATPSCLLWGLGLLIAILLAGRKVLEPLAAVLLLASFGFIIAVVVQGKGWPYHGYPAVALVLLLPALLVLRDRARSGAAALCAMAFYLLLLPTSAVWFSQSNEPKGLVQAVEKLAPAHPRIIAISPDLAVGHPLTRLVQGTWVGTANSMWMTAYADYMLLQKPDARTASRIRAYATLDRKLLFGDVQKQKPDVILVDLKPSGDWTYSPSAFRQVLAGYRRAQTVSGVEIWLRDAAR